MLTGWVYPIIAHAVWDSNGFLSAYSVDPLWGVGMVDFAGSGVVHLTGGTTALFATLILGPRRGRFHDETGRRLETPREFQGHSVALQVWNETMRTGRRRTQNGLVFLHFCLFSTFADAGNVHFVVWMVRFQRRQRAAQQFS